LRANRERETATMVEGHRDFIAGTVGGFSGKLFDYPFDTVKVLLQTQSSLPSTTAVDRPTSTVRAAPPAPPPVYRGALHCLAHTVDTRGVSALYRGISAPLLGSMAENAVLFFSYGKAKQLLGEHPAEGEELSLLQLATAGGAAGAVASFVLNPFEVIKGEHARANATQAGDEVLVAGNERRSLHDALRRRNQCKCR